MTDEEIRAALELAQGHLEDAENVVWESASRAKSDEVSDHLQELSREIWSVQHSIIDFQKELQYQAIDDPPDKQQFVGDENE
ncbi:hypothetical protein OB955_19775 [Halobacteria archaeon AArc-m2/3/4]|uniref:Uncharacterized protein n=1 Tax=Natronoglomus mannanivorans TaxID=2979990 RepID=A0ABT2QJ46_9EURY|nr:hypothetical protein [Halobacteria archaeon AArc-m2/3/4]